MKYLSEHNELKQEIINRTHSIYYKYKGKKMIKPLAYITYLIIQQIISLENKKTNKQRQEQHEES